jgi:hypothetical protein
MNFIKVSEWFARQTVKKETVSESITLDTSIHDILIEHGWVKRGDNYMKSEWLKAKAGEEGWYKPAVSIGTAFHITIEEALTLIPKDLRWVTRYSQTDEPDKHGRWARMMVLNDITHAWVSRIVSNNEVVYSASLKFPTLQNDTIHDHFFDKDFTVVKEWCEAELAKYIKTIKRLK